MRLHGIFIHFITSYVMLGLNMHRVMICFELVYFFFIYLLQSFSYVIAFYTYIFIFLFHER